MKIDRVTLNHVRIPLAEPFRTGTGSIEESDGIIVAVSSDGITGVGEALPMPGSSSSSDTLESVWTCLSEAVVPQFIRRVVYSLDEVNTMLNGLSVSPVAAAGMETAFWDLEAQRRGEPLMDTLGAKKSDVSSGLCVGVYPAVEELLAAIERYRDEGYASVMIRIRPGWDVKPIEAVRKKFGAIPLMVDAACAYTREHVGHLKELDAFDLQMIEQPFGKDDLHSHAVLQSQMRTPICLDEGAKDPATVEMAIRRKSCRMVNIKVQRVGGLLRAKQIHDICQDAGIPVLAGAMPGSGIGSAQALHMAMLPGFTFPAEVQSSRRWFVQDIIEPSIILEGGRIRLPAGTGNCYKLNRKVMERHKVRDMVF